MTTDWSTCKKGRADMMYSRGVVLLSCPGNSTTCRPRKRDAPYVWGSYDLPALPATSYWRVEQSWEAPLTVHQEEERFEQARSCVDDKNHWDPRLQAELGAAVRAMWRCLFCGLLFTLGLV